MRIPTTPNLILAGLVTCLGALPLSAAELAVNLPIDAVTVYPAGAEVTRSGMQTLPAGSHRLVLTGLPAQLDPGRLQIHIASDAVSLGALQLEQQFQEGLMNPEEQRLQNELEALEDGRLAITDEIEAANTQLKLLDSLAAGAGSQQDSVSAQELTELLSSLGAASASARETIRDANRRLRQQDREIARKQFELSQVQTRQQVANTIAVEIQVSAAVSVPVSLTYPVAQAGWEWLYEARLATDSGRLDLARKVSVQQTTGEDWDGVSMTITTARPGENTQTPHLGSLLVDLLQVMPLRAEPGVMEMRDMAVSSAATASFSPMEVSATRYLVEYAVPGRVNLAANSQPQVLGVAREELAVNLVTRVVPERDTDAYLEARFDFAQPVPLLAGLMQFYRDGAFIGSRPVPTLLPGEAVSLPFGKDDRVRVTVAPVEAGSRDGGVLRRSVEEHRSRFDIVSYHNQSMAVEVVGRIPVTQNQDVSVEILPGATPAQVTDLDGQAGVLLWRLDAAPGQTRSINHFYRVSFPRDSQLWYQDN